LRSNGEGVSLGGLGSVAAVAIALALAPASGEDLLRAFADDRDGVGAAALSLARSAFDAYVLHRERIPVPGKLPVLLRERSAVFVSAERDGAPRCCMGSLYSTHPTLAEEIITAAVAAAGVDARREPVQPQELTQLRLIVSIIAPPESIDDPAKIDPVREGIAARSRTRTGVVLPGETPHLERAIKWARIRAAAEPNEVVDYFRIRAFRIAEPKPVEPK
jgi:AMMECR1 domain-containing protein